MKHRNLLPVIVFSLFLFSIVSPYAAKQYPAMVPATAARQSRVQRNPEEGFAAGALVRTRGGHQPIEIITKYDIVLDDHAQPKHVLRVITPSFETCSAAVTRKNPKKPSNKNRYEYTEILYFLLVNNVALIRIAVNDYQLYFLYISLLHDMLK